MWSELAPAGFVVVVGAVVSAVFNDVVLRGITLSFSLTISS